MIAAAGQKFGPFLAGQGPLWSPFSSIWFLLHVRWNAWVREKSKKAVKLKNVVFAWPRQPHLFWEPLIQKIGFILLLGHKELFWFKGPIVQESAIDPFRGLYSSLLSEKPHYNKLGPFYKKNQFLATFIKNSVLAQRTKGQNATYKQFAKQTCFYKIKKILKFHKNTFFFIKYATFYK